MTYRLDHLVLPVADLDVARARLAALGFTVAPDGVHPFGTANCCVFMSDGTFLEPLAIWDTSMAADAIRAGNVFVARDHVFRAAVGEEGLSAVVLATRDADADHARFTTEGIAIGDVLTFSRDFVDSSGKKDVASFKLAFAGEPAIADAFAFSCERVNSPNVDRSALQRHSNGVSSISGVVLADDARDFAELLGQMTHSDGPQPVVDFDLRFDMPDEDDGAVKTILALVLRVDDVHALSGILDGNGVNFERDGARIIVPPAPGQGVHFIFETSQ